MVVPGLTVALFKLPVSLLLIGVLRTRMILFRLANFVTVWIGKIACTDQATRFGSGMSGERVD
jgi:hypothetical protein